MLAGGTTLVVSKIHSAQYKALVAHAYTRGHVANPKYRAVYGAVLANLRAKTWPEENRQAEAKIESRQQVDETVNAVTIDLKPHINAALTDSPASPIGNNKNNFAELPSGIHIFAGVPFDVEGLIQLDGINMKMFKKEFPAEVNILINRKCSKIHLFHGADWIDTQDFGTVIAKLILHYADGSTQEIGIVAGEHVFDCWAPLFTTGVDPRCFKMAPGTERAWTGSNPFIKNFFPDESLILYKSTFDDPEPDKVISSLDYASTMTGTAPFLVGLTVE
jgi:hypothetical protein